MIERKWNERTDPMPYIMLDGYRDAFVRTTPSPNGRYLFQFRTTVSYAVTVEAAKELIEAAAEFFEVMHRNPFVS